MAVDIHIMGIVNLTPDSFYAGSRCEDAGGAIACIRKMLADGACTVDIGACSTRPGAEFPSLEEEWSRLEPVLTEIAAESISIDTFRPEIVRRAYNMVGPFIVNDVSGGCPEMFETVKDFDLPYIATHNRPFDADVVRDVVNYFHEVESVGVPEVIMDPGFGFNKTLEENYDLLRRLDEVTSATERPVMVGISRKSMIYKPLGITPEEALPATQVLHFAAMERGAAWLRVHDVPDAMAAVKLFHAFRSQPVC